MKPRSEDDILARTPLKVKLGDKEYEIPLLAVMPQRAWRKQLFETVTPVLDSFNLRADGKSMTTGLAAALLQVPEKLAELLFAYAPELPKEDILATATEEQIGEFFRYLQECRRQAVRHGSAVSAKIEGIENG